MTAEDAISTSRKSKRELREVTGDKRQLIEVAQQLAYIDRSHLRDSDVEEFDSHDGGIVRSVKTSADFRDTWAEIVDVMSIVAPVETREKCTSDGMVVFRALADGSQRSLKVRYYEDGSLDVRASWAESPSASMAMIVVDETYEL